MRQHSVPIQRYSCFIASFLTLEVPAFWFIDSKSIKLFKEMGAPLPTQTRLVITMAPWLWVFALLILGKDYFLKSNGIRY
jgi:hypothetical protein